MQEDMASVQEVLGECSPMPGADAAEQDGLACSPSNLMKLRLMWQLKQEEGKIGQNQAALTELTAALLVHRQRIVDTKQQLEGSQRVMATWQAKDQLAQHPSPTQRQQLLEKLRVAEHEPLQYLLEEQAELRRRAAQATESASTYRVVKGMMEIAEVKLDLNKLIRSAMQKEGEDVVPLTTVQAANDMVRSAAKDMNEALVVAPEMPYLDRELLERAKGGMFKPALQSVRVGIDTVVQLAVLHSIMADVECLALQVMQVVEWAVENRTALEAEAAQCRRAADGKMQEAIFCKAALVEQAASPGKGSSPVKGSSPSKGSSTPGKRVIDIQCTAGGSPGSGIPTAYP